MASLRHTIVDQGVRTVLLGGHMQPMKDLSWPYIIFLPETYSVLRSGTIATYMMMKGSINV